LAEVGPDDEVEEALAAMQRTGAHLARVVVGTRDAGVGADDGDAATERDAAPPAEALRVLGVVFFEDILEELVGEVRDAMQRRAP
jgi:CBS domain-containing protein